MFKRRSSFLFPMNAGAYVVYVALCSCSPVDGANVSEAATLNNNGVNLLKKNDYLGAAKEFKEALKARPGYALARENLSITYNNLGLATQETPAQAIKHMHLAALLCPGDATVQSNLDFLMEALDKDPKSFSDVVEEAETCLKQGDRIGAVVEYKRALNINHDPKIQLLLGSTELPQEWKELLSQAEPNDVDFAPYMTRLEKKLKKAWEPTAGDPANKVVVLFKIKRDGMVPAESIRLSKTSGSNNSDRAALKAIATAQPLPRLPRGSRAEVDIEFTFSKDDNAAETAAVDNGHNESNAEVGDGTSKNRDTTPTGNSAKSNRLSLSNSFSSGTTAKSDSASTGIASTQEKRKRAKAAAESTLNKWIPYAVNGLLIYAAIGLVICFIIALVVDRNKKNG